LTAIAAAAIAVSTQAQITAPAGQAYTIGNTAAATAANPITYQWYRNNVPISGATGLSYTVPAVYAYGDNVTFYRMAKTLECSGEAEKPSNSIIITFTGYVTPPGGCNLVIGGICWADVHVDQPQIFATRADMNTRFYQWNRLTAYSTDDPLAPAWDPVANESETWTVNPCPPDWRLPTQPEYQQLHNAGTTWADVGAVTTQGLARGNAVPGRFYGYNHTVCRLPSNMQGCVFFPASGCRSYTDGALTSRGTYGSGWSSTQKSSTNGYYLSFYSASSYPADNGSKAVGFPIRCVR